MRKEKNPLFYLIEKTLSNKKIHIANISGTKNEFKARIIINYTSFTNIYIYIQNIFTLTR